jgi:integrase
MTRLDTVESRSKLRPRHEPYWQRMANGCYLGFRKMTTTSIGSWIAMYWDSESKKKTKHSVGDFSELPPSQRFDAARQASDEWFKHLGRGGSPEYLTVRAACEKWVEHKLNLKGQTVAKEAEDRFNRWVYNDKIARVLLNKLTRNHVDIWRAAMTNTAVVINPHGEEKKTRARSASTINREMSELRAALNFAYDNNWITDDSAWRQSLKPIKNAEQRRGIYLDESQRKSLIENSNKFFAEFLTGLCLIPLRPGALANLTARDFDSRLGVLTVGKDKQGQDRRIQIPQRSAIFLTTMCIGKSTDSPMFAREDGKAWDRHTWKKLFNTAVESSGLPDKCSLYSLRHSGITDLVTNGLDLLTTALISGTSVAMIERHYGHLRQEHASNALAKLNFI